MKKNKTNKIIVALLLSAIIIFVPLESVRADAWGANYSAAILKQTMERIDIEIHGAIMGALKQAAVQTINSSVSAMISGGGTSGSLIINDPYKFIFTDTDREARLSVKSFLDSSLRGRGSGLNYVPAGMDEGILGNYYANLYRSASKVIEPGGASRINLDCCSDPSDPFAKGNWCCFNSLFSGNPMANPLGAQLVTEGMLISEKEQREKLAMSRYQTGGGFRDVIKNGQVITPGSAIASMQAGVQDLGNKIIASAQNIPEVITAIVTRIATNAIRQGIGNAQRNVQKEINNVTSGVRRDVNEAVQQSGPGTIFKPSY